MVKGYNPDSHKAHPGVTISVEHRAGRKVLLLRWREVLPGGREGKRKACYALNAAGLKLVQGGQPAQGENYMARSRTKARAHAVHKSAELAAERVQLAAVQPTKEINPNATWAELEAGHYAFLARKDRRPATLRAHRFSWGKFRDWRDKPALPKQLTLLDLENYRAHLSRKGMSPHSVNSLLVHFKAALNYGRRRMKCIRVDDVDITQGLEPVKAVNQPVALSASKLAKILDAAGKYDAEHPGAQTFPILAFVMVTGCRLGEMQSLRWAPSKAGAAESWPDFHAGMLRVYGHKTTDLRSLPLDTRPALARMLQVLHGRTDTQALPFVFGGPLPLAVRDKRVHGVTDADGRKVVGRSAKAALAEVRKASGADWKIKDLRSTTATYLANSRMYGSLLNTLADHLGHDPDVLKDHYLGKLTLPAEQRDAVTVEAVLGIAGQIENWCNVAEGAGGKLLRMNRGA